MGKPILSIDFDGVCHSYTTKWQGAAIIPDPPVDGLDVFLMRAVEHFEVNIFSTRSHQEGGKEAMIAWFYRYVHKPTVDKLKFPLTKPPAAVGIDDRVLTFEGVWPSMETLVNFKPWNKRGI
jgi:hypothetical protein